MPSDAEPSDVFDRDALELLRAVAVRAQIGTQLLGGGTEAVLRTVVDAAVALFQAEAASIALYDAAADRLVFRVAAGAQGPSVVGLSVGPGEGLVGYVFSTGQSIAQSDVERDARFGRAIADQTRYVPRSLVAVPLVDETGTIGVLEVLDKRDSASFSLQDIELAGVFAHQAAVAITASRLERDVAALLGAALRELLATARPAPVDASAGAIDVVARVVANATEGLDGDDEEPRWELVERIARIRHADAGELDLVVELLDALARHAEKATATRRRRRS